MRPGTTRVLAAVTVGLTAGAFVQAEVSARQQAGAAGEGPARFTHIARQVFPTPDGGRVAVGADTPRRVLVQHQDAATGTWDEPTVLFEQRGVTCGEVEGRASAGGVALTLLCDAPYYEDTAPARSQALVSADGRTWQRHELPGEAYQPPAISPGGGQAAWLVGGDGVLRWDADDGFLAPVTTRYRHDSSGETVVVADNGDVTVLGPEPGAGGCVLGVHERTVDGRHTHQQVAGVEVGCTEGLVDAPDAFTVVPQTTRPYRWEVARDEAGAPWRVVRRAPADAPGLRRYRTRGALGQAFSDVTRHPLLSVGSPDRDAVTVQAYDEGRQRWTTPRTVARLGAEGCRHDRALDHRTLDVHVRLLRCDGGRAVALVSGDGETWRAPVLGRRPLSVSRDGRWVGAPTGRGLLVVDRSGIERRPLHARSRCGFLVVEDGEVARLHAAAGDAWPRALQVHRDGRWRTVARVRLPAQGPCRHVRADHHGTTTRYTLGGRGVSATLRVTRRGGEWRVARGWS